MALFDWLFGRSPEPPQRNQPQPSAPENRTPQIARTPSRPAFAHAHTYLSGRMYTKSGRYIHDNPEVFDRLKRKYRTMAEAAE